MDLLYISLKTLISTSNRASYDEFQHHSRLSKYRKHICFYSIKKIISSKGSSFTYLSYLIFKIEQWWVFLPENWFDEKTGIALFQTFFDFLTHCVRLSINISFVKMISRIFIFRQNISIHHSGSENRKKSKKVQYPFFRQTNFRVKKPTTILF